MALLGTPHADIAGTTCVVHNIGALVSAPPGSEPARGNALREVVSIDGAAVAIAGDMIVAAGTESEVRAALVAAGVELTGDAVTAVDAHGMLVTPGFVDCHTHPVFGGDRADEFAARASGGDYEALLAAGGGINSTVQRTRELDLSTLAAEARKHFDWMLAAGTTTVDARSGYGLSLEHELQQLDAIWQAARDHPLNVEATLLACHAVPRDFAGDAAAYARTVGVPAVEEVARRGAARTVDAFVERNAFAPADLAEYVQAARDSGLDIRLHVDQFSEQGGIDLALKYGARSVDHLEATGAAGVAAIAASDMAAVLLPASSLQLSRPYAPGRALADAGAIVAVASDFNPGSSFTESMPLVVALAVSGCGLHPNEAFIAATANAAWTMRRSDVGRIAPGMRADLVVLDHPDIRHIAYHVGHSGIQTVITGGRVAWSTRAAV